MRPPIVAAARASGSRTANSSPPSRARSSPGRRTERRRGPDLGEHEVAGVMAEGVVELLEAVEVDQQQRGRAAALARGGEDLAQPALEPPPVREPRELVGVGLAADLGEAA